VTAEVVSAALKAYRAGLDAADTQMAATIAQAHLAIAEATRCRDATVLLAMATCQKILDAECEPGFSITIRVPAECAHVPEDSPAGVLGCCAMAGAS
jgi:hypothetical protein